MYDTEWRSTAAEQLHFTKSIKNNKTRRTQRVNGETYTNEITK